MKQPNQADRLRLAERIIKAAADEGENTVTLKTALAQWLLERAAAAKGIKGRARMPGRERIQQSMAVRGAQRRKKELAQTGVRKEKAAEIAATEASKKLKYRLSASTILRMMQAPRKNPGKK